MENFKLFLLIAGLGLTLGFFSHIGDKIGKKLWPPKTVDINVSHNNL